MQLWKTALVAGVAAIAFGADAKAATVIDFTDSASEVDFVTHFPGVTRNIDWNGSFSYASGLGDGIYGVADLLTFSSVLHFTLNISGQPTSEAFYNFSRNDFSSLALTLKNGSPIAIAFAFNVELPFSATGVLTSTYASISGDTANEPVVDFYFGPSSTGLNLAAHDGDGGITLVEEAVPEPSTWLLMLLGFGSIGAAMRSQRRVTAQVAYSIG